MKWLAIISMALLVGCSSAPKQPEPIVKTQVVEVPVSSTIVSPPTVTMPELPIHNLTKDSTPKEVAEAYAKSIELLKIEIVYRGLLLDMYRIGDE